MAGLVPAIHVDPRDKPGDDDWRTSMRWLERWLMQRAAKQYARRLGPHLTRAYGAAEHYTASQIRASVAKLGLNPKYITIGYAAYLPSDEYAAAASAPVSIPYGEARRFFERFRPTALFSPSDNAGRSLSFIETGYSGRDGSPRS